ncbi:hypothetical protein ACFE04_000814 [Oxalis oulophora]
MDIGLAGNSSILIDELVSASNQTSEPLRPEDLAWADSCLVTDPQTSHIDWNSVKDVLLDVFISQTDFSAVQGTDTEMVFSTQPEETSDMKLLASFEEITAEKVADQQLYPLIDVGSDEETDILMSQVLQTDSLDPIFPADDNHRDLSNELNNEEDVSMSQVFQNAISQPIIGEEFPLTSTDDQKEIGFDLVSPVIEMDPSVSSIFKVWDLEIPTKEAEEEEDDDEFAKQLKEALKTACLPPNDNSEALKDLKVESVDDLIAGLEDLSL